MQPDGVQTRYRAASRATILVAEGGNSMEVLDPYTSVLAALSAALLLVAGGMAKKQLVWKRAVPMRRHRRRR
jgi:hypothetical protein